MSERQGLKKHKREWLKLMGASVVFVPLSALQGCSRANGPNEQDTLATKTADSTSGQASVPEEPVQKNAATSAETAQLPRVSETDPDSESLGYRHDATEVDQAKFPQYEAGQLCSNCSVYAQNDSAKWSTCPIFPGKLVNADGWCALYAPVS